MVTETSQSKPVQEQDQQASQQIQSAPVSHINRSDMSRTNFYGTKAYQYPPETQNVSGFVQNKIMPNRVQSRDVRNNPPTSSGATCSSTDPWKHPGQTYDYQTMAGSDERQEVQLKLPLPPKQMHHGMSRHNQRLQNYTFAHVPTAQAEFPVDYDARLGAPSERNLSDSDEALADKSEQFSENLDSSNLLSQKAHESIGDKMKNSAKSEKSKSMQEKIEENLKNKTDIVIKKLDSSRPVPKFIPRQAQIKKTPSVTGHTNTDKVKHTENDPVNRELKRNAFTLGKPQGPINPGSELVQETEEVEESVNKTVKDIRKRMIQVHILRLNS